MTVNQPAVTNLTGEICQGETYNENGFSVTASGIHTLNLQTVHGCDSTVNLTLTVNQPAVTNLTAEICQGETYDENGFSVTTAGIHTLNLQTIHGCDSTVNLTLTVNQPAVTNLTGEICQGETYNENGFSVTTAGVHTLNLQTIHGCDSIVNLTLTVNQPAVTNLTGEICQGETYNENGFSVTTAGVHTLNLQTIHGCDSTVNLTLTVNQPAVTNLTGEICQGETYNENGFSVTASGIHTLNLQTVHGCDSTVNLTLTVNQPAVTNLTGEICQGETYNGNGFSATTAGIHTLNLQTIHGCDSTVNLTLTVNQPAVTNLTGEICQGETYNENGFSVTTAGVHTLNLQTIHGCDSTVNLTLTVNQPAVTNLTGEICQGETYNENGFSVTTSGIHTLNLQTIHGCDSIVNLTLTVNQPAVTNLTGEICQGETYNENGFSVTTAGIHTLNLQTVHGCDSTVNLTLTVNQPAVTNLTGEICQGETYNENGFSATTAGVHTLNLQTVHGCDSTVNLTLTVNQPAVTNLTASICQGETYNENGFNESTAGIHTQNLQTIHGCDSTVNLTLTVNQPAVTNLTAEICQGQTYNENGFSVTTAGVHTINLQTVHGCDSTVNLTLAVNQPAVTNLTGEICQGETYNENGFSVTTAGIHTLNLQTVHGCDSTVNLTLKVNQPAVTNLTGEICQGETYNENGFNVTTAGIHTLNLQTVHGCDSTVNLTIIVNPIYHTNEEITVCEASFPYRYGDTLFDQAGTYNVAFNSISGCDSTVTLILLSSVNNIYTTNRSICDNQVFFWRGGNYTLPGTYYDTSYATIGCDTIFVLKLTVNSRQEISVAKEVCGKYNWNGVLYTTSGIYTQNLHTIHGCDSIVNLTLTVNQPAVTNLTGEICQGETYNENGFSATTDGIHTLNLQTIHGCDSTVNLTLTVNQPAVTNLTGEICQGETYSENGFSVTTSGIHTQNLQTIHGCDSTVNLTLTVNQPAVTNLTGEICQGETYSENGFSVTTSGIHTQNLQTIHGCDSTVNLTLTVNQPAVTNLTAEICQGEIYNENGFSVTTAGVHTINLQTVHGCDSTVNLILTVNQPAVTNLTAEICQGETYNENGFSATTDGIHTLNLQTVHGCDSTVNLTLTINQPAVTNLTGEICQGETYNENGFSVTTSGIHTLNLQTIHGCDSTVNLTLTVNQPAVTNLTGEICQGETYNENGFSVTASGIHTLNLQTIHGCDSTVNLTLTVNQPVVTNLTGEICQGETYNENGFSVTTAGIHTLNLQTGILYSRL